jgi:hypothetical protein
MFTIAFTKNLLIRQSIDSRQRLAKAQYTPTTIGLLSCAVSLATCNVTHTSPIQVDKSLMKDTGDTVPNFAKGFGGAEL